MELWIESQDKRCLLKVNNIEVAGTAIITREKDVVGLGYYNEKRALEIKNEIANGTHRKKVEYESKEFTYNEEYHDYYSRYNGWLFDKVKNLNDEVEIIEEVPKEEKKIEKLSNVTIFGATLTSLRDELQATNKRFENKLNEIIDKINRKND